MFLQTLSRSSLFMNPSRGEKKPWVILITSRAVWPLMRSTLVHFSTSSLALSLSETTLSINVPPWGDKALSVS